MLTDVYFLYIRDYILTLFLSSTTLDPDIILIKIKAVCLTFMGFKHRKIMLQVEQQLYSHKKLE